MVELTRRLCVLQLVQLGYHHHEGGQGKVGYTLCGDVYLK